MGNIPSRTRSWPLGRKSGSLFAKERTFEEISGNIIGNGGGAGAGAGMQRWEIGSQRMRSTVLGFVLDNEVCLAIFVLIVPPKVVF